MRAIAVILKSNSLGGVILTTHFEVTSDCPKDAIDIDAVLKEHLNWCDTYYEENKSKLEWFFIQSAYIPLFNRIDWPWEAEGNVNRHGVKAAVYRACAIEDVSLKDAIIQSVKADVFGKDTEIMRAALDLGWDPKLGHVEAIEASLVDKGVDWLVDYLLKGLKSHYKDDPLSAIPLGAECYVWKARDYIDDCRYEYESKQMRKSLTNATLIGEVRQLRARLCEDTKDRLIGSRIIALEEELRERGFVFDFVQTQVKS